MDCVAGLNSAPAGMSALSLMFSVKPWESLLVVDDSVAAPSQPCCRLTSPQASPSKCISTQVAGRDTPRCTVPSQPESRGMNWVSPPSTETVFSIVLLSSALLVQKEKDLVAPLLVRRIPAPSHVAARGLKSDASERGVQRLELSAWVGAERTGAMVEERARQRERTDLSVPDAKQEGDIM